MTMVGGGLTSQHLFVSPVFLTEYRRSFNNNAHLIIGLRETKPYLPASGSEIAEKPAALLSLAFLVARLWTCTIVPVSAVYPAGF